MRRRAYLRASIGALALAGASSTTLAVPGELVLVQAGILLAQRPSLAVRPIGLSNPESFIRVHRAPETPSDTLRVSTPEAHAAADAEARGLIAVPSSARAGDPAFEVPAPDESEYVFDDTPTSYTTGTAFADGVVLGYSSLHGPHWRPGRPRPRPRPAAADAPEFGSGDLHRSAQLRFSEAAQPRLEHMDDAWRRAQLEFRRSTLAPGQPRGSDGLRHERTSPAPTRPQR